MDRYTKTTKGILDFFPTTTIASSTTRLDGVIYLDETTKTYWQNHNYNLNIPKNSLNSSKWITVTKEMQYRPDIISYLMYGNESLFWVILNHNKITDPFDIEVGLVLEIPAIGEITNAIKTKRDLENLK